MALTAGALTKVAVYQNSVVVSSAVATGGTGPYTYQWYMSTSSGFTPGGGNILSGVTSLGPLTVSGLTANTTYYFKVVSTDTGNSNATIISSQLVVVPVAASLSATDKVHFANVLGSAAVANELLACIASKSVPSVATQKVLADCFGDQWNSLRKTSTSETLAAIQTGQALSLSTQRKWAIMCASRGLATKIVNLFQGTQLPLIKI
jgi:hypothetical protein